MTKKIITAVVVFAVLAAVAISTNAAQNIYAYVAQNFVSGDAQLLITDKQGAILISQGATSALNVATSSVIQTGAGRVAKVNVLIAGAAGALYDSATVTNAAAANQIAVIPATVGVVDIDFPFTNGLIYIPGTSQTASISYNK
jgi:hypothetical protein